MGRRWEDFFYFSKSDRRALLLLIGILVGVIVTSTVILWVERDEKGETGADETVFHFACMDEPQAMKSTEAVPETYRQSKEFVPETFYFDPNTADSTAFLRLGLQPWQVRNIYKYRAKGGRYHRPEDFARLYGLTKGDYDRLFPYIRIADEYRLLSDVSPSIVHRTEVSGEVPHEEKFEEGTQIDLNTADTVLLKRIPGIGSYYARRITDYRERLGGFVSMAQLCELEGLPDSVERWFVLSSDEAPRKLFFNRLSVEKLCRHPYLNFRQARVIAEHRRKYGAIKRLQALALYEEFTPADLERLQPYVSFDE